MNNYSYITLLSDDSYIYGIILLQESLKRVNTQYPLEVLVTDNVTKPILNILDQLQLKYRVVESIKCDKFLNYNITINPQFAKIWSLTFTKFEMFRLVEYDKIIYLDADILVMKNLDHLFEYPHLSCAIDGEYFNLWPEDPFINGGLMVIKPDIEEYNGLINFMNNMEVEDYKKQGCIADQEIINTYYSDWADKPELHLNKYYNVFAPYILEDQIEDIEENAYFIHFIGRKPWRAFAKPAEETYTEKFYEDAKAIVQTRVNQLDWTKAKESIKLTVYGICKDEMVNIEEYLQCFSKADYVCLLDTGSTDGTWEYLQDAQKRYPNLIIGQKIINPWRYDEARNYSLTLVPKDTVMYFMMDLDERIHDKGWVEIIKSAWDPLFSRCCYTYNRQIDPETGAVTQCFDEYRIHSKIWHYEGIVHELLNDITNQRLFYADECHKIPIAVWHYSTVPNREVYIELCERGVAEQPDNWLMHLQLAAEYEVHNLYEKAIQEYTKIIVEADTLFFAEIGRCYASLGRAYSNLGNNDEAIKILKKGMQVVPTCGDCYFFAAEIYYTQHKFKDAIKMCEEGLRMGKEKYWCTIISNDSHYPYVVLGLSHFYTGNKVLGLGYVTLARERNNSEEINRILNWMTQEINRG